VTIRLLGDNYLIILETENEHILKCKLSFNSKKTIYNFDQIYFDIYTRIQCECGPYRCTFLVQPILGWVLYLQEITGTTYILILNFVF
jgi:hypothetical protein